MSQVQQLANLVRLYQALGQNGLDNTLGFIGFKFKDDELDIHAQRPDQAPETLQYLGSHLTVTKKTAGDSKNDRPPLNFWLYTEVKYHEVQENLSAEKISQPVATLPPLPDSTLSKKSDLHVAHQPLVRWSEIWPWLQRSFAQERVTHRVDINALQRQVTHGKPIQSLPKLRENKNIKALQLWMDLNKARMRPFFQDMWGLERNLQRLYGEQGLSVWLLDDVDDPFEDFSPHSSHLEGYRPHINAQQAILILSDLGVYDVTGKATQCWLNFGRLCAKENCRPLVLLPSAINFIPDVLHTVFTIQIWDRGHRFATNCAKKIAETPKDLTLNRCVSPEEKTQQFNVYAEDMLACVAPAVNVEFGLLREVRHLNHALTAAHEAAACLNSDIEPNCFGIAFNIDRGLETSPYHRKFLKKNRQEKAAIYNCIQSYHRQEGEEIRLEEAFQYATLSGQDITPYLEHFEKEQQEFAEHLQGEEQVFANQWSQRLCLRMPHRARSGKHALQYHRIAAVLYDEILAGRVALPAGIDHIGLLNNTNKKNSTQKCCVFQWGDALYIQPEADERVEGFTLLDLTVANSELTLELYPRESKVNKTAMGSPDDIGTITTRLQFSQPVVLVRDLSAYRKIIIKSYSGAYTLESRAKPSWAETFFRNKHESRVQYRTPNHGEQLAHWFPPGLYSIAKKQPNKKYFGLKQQENHIELADKWSLKKGFYWNEATKNRYFDTKEKQFILPSWGKSGGVDQYGLYVDMEFKGITQRFRYIPPGEFVMGSPEGEPERYDDETQHAVVLTQGYWLADTHCTQALWQAVMGDNPNDFKGEKNLPVDNVNWDDCQRFIEKLNHAVPELSVRLPTEAEWEYACRAGTRTPFHFGENITPDQVNYDVGEKRLYRETTVPVASLPCNEWGLYEMHGNLDEWCSDWYQGDLGSAEQVDPKGPKSGEYRVLRGGSWIDLAGDCRSADRDRNEPGYAYRNFGLRLSRG